MADGAQGRLAQQTAVVTGSSSGIGRAIACRFAAEGAHVLCSDVERAPQDRAVPTDELITRGGGSATYVPADVARASDNDHLVAEAVRVGGRLDVLVANAGIGGPVASIHELDESDWDRVLAVNLRGAFLGLRSAIRQMLVQSRRGGVRGRCIAVASNHGMVGPPRSPAYAASKGGLLNLVRQAAVDYGNEGILVNAVAPGKILRDGDLEETLAYARARTPFDRLGSPEDVASAVLYLAADASYVSGATLSVDGGWMAY